MSKMLTLEELAQMTAQQGGESSEIRTVDLSPTTADDYDYRNLDKTQAKVDALTNWTVDGDTGDDNPQIPQMYQPKGNMRPVQTSELAPPPEKKTGETLSDKWVADLDKALDRDRQQMWDNLIEPKFEELSEQAVYGDENPAAPLAVMQDNTTTPILKNNSDEDDFFMDSTPQVLSAVEDFKFDIQIDVDTVKIEENKLEEDTMDNETNIPLTDTENKVTSQDSIQNEGIVENTQSEPIKPAVDEKPINPVLIGVDLGLGNDIASHKTPVENSTKIEEDADSLSTKAITSIEITKSIEEENISSMDLNKMFPDTDPEEEDSDETTVELTDADKDEEIKNIQMVIRKEARPSTIINLSEYTVASKATSATKVLASMANKPKHSANWALLTAGRPITMSELSGPEIEKLDPSAETGLNEVMRNKELYSVFFDHMVDANKPDSFEAWSKTIPFVDVPHLYFAAYRASFSHAANLLPFQCNSCKHSFMEKKPVESMVKFKDDAAKETIKDILKQDPTNRNLDIKSKIFIISDEIAISFKTPSIYNIVFETAILPEKFRTVYQNLVYYINCIEDIFKVDQTNKKLIKIETKVDATDLSKTVAYRYRAFASILQKMSPDEFSYIPVCMKEVNPDTSELISYQIPETVCPRCGKKIAAQDMDAISLLFTRLRLQTILTL